LAVSCLGPRDWKGVETLAGSALVQVKLGVSPMRIYQWDWPSQWYSPIVAGVGFGMVSGSTVPFSTDPTAGENNWRALARPAGSIGTLGLGARAEFSSSSCAGLGALLRAGLKISSSGASGERSAMMVRQVRQGST